MGRTAVYTCITGGYDVLRQPLALKEGYDFICFVGKGEKTAERDGEWEIRELPVTTGDAGLDSRWPKMHPHELLQDYETSVWIDSNILIKGQELYDATERMIEEDVIYAGVTHPDRDSLYAEARKCRDMGYIGWLDLARIHFVYWFRGIPPHTGLLENNLIFRRHLEPVIVALDELWWKKVCNFCRRDQLSLIPCMRRFGLVPALLLPRGQNTRNNPGFEYQLHKKACQDQKSV